MNNSALADIQALVSSDFIDIIEKKKKNTKKEIF